MAKLVQSGYSELTVMNSSAVEKKQEKVLENSEDLEKTEEKKVFFEGIGRYREFEGGLMDDDDKSYTDNPILTSKEAVLKHKKNYRACSRLDESGANSACQQCMVI